MKQIHVLVSGFVQGVGFRRFVRHHARKIGVVGWVRNLQDGRVEAVMQGDEKQLLRMIRHCQKGPFFSQVVDIAVEWEEVSVRYEDFTILK